MSDWVLGLSYGVMLISVMAAAEGFFEPLNPLTLEHFVGEAEIPTDENTWSACCHHRDCQEAKIHVAYQPGDWAQVAVDAYPIFELETAKIFRSINGKSYFCRQDLARSPDRENTRCVFHSQESYVRR